MTVIDQPDTQTLDAARARIDVADGVLTYSMDGRPVIRALAQARAVDGRSIDTTTARLADAVRRAVTSELGEGVQLDLTYDDPNGLRLLHRLTVGASSPEVLVQCVLSDGRGQVETRFLAPLVTRPPERDLPEQMRSYNLRMHNVPYDNTMWVRYELVPPRPGRTSFEYTALHAGSSWEGLVIGAVDQDDWKNAVACSASDARCFIAYSGAASATSHDSLPHGSLVGPSVASARFLLGYYPDVRHGLARYGDVVAQRHPPLDWADGVPFGWNSWSGLAFRLDGDNYAAAGDVVARLQAGSFENDGTTYVNLDAGWNRIPVARLVDEVETLHGRGQRAGVYAAPFAYFGADVDAEIDLVPGHTYREILLRDDRGDLLPRVDGAHPMDVTHPLWEQLTRAQFGRFVAWGFDYVKLDFLSHGGMEGAHHDPAVRTGRRALHRGYGLIRELLAPARIGRPFFISLSIAPLVPSGYGHARRFSCDAFGRIEDTEYLLNALTYGWWQSGRLYHLNDPDHITLFQSFEDRRPTTMEEARARYTAAVISGTVMMLSDDYGPAGDAEAHAAARERAFALATNPEVNAVARLGRSFVPAELAGVSASPVYVLRDGVRAFVALFNFDREAQSFELDLPRILAPSSEVHPDSVLRRDADEAGTLTVRELWTHEETRACGVMTWELAPCDAALFEVRPAG